MQSEYGEGVAFTLKNKDTSMIFIYAINKPQNIVDIHIKVRMNRNMHGRKVQR